MSYLRLNTECTFCTGERGRLGAKEAVREHGPHLSGKATGSTNNSWPGEFSGCNQSGDLLLQYRVAGKGRKSPCCHGEGAENSSPMLFCPPNLGTMITEFFSKGSHVLSHT